MQTVNNHPEFKYDDPIWYLIAEYSLSEVSQEEAPQAGLTDESILQTLRQLRLPAEQITRIESSIYGIAREVKYHIDGDKPNSPVIIRLYCQRRVTSLFPSQPTKHFDTERSAGTLQQFHNTLTKSSGGWGHFLVEKGKVSADASQEATHCVIELYLYKEGE